KDTTKAVEESDSDVDDVYDKTAQFMTCGGANARLLEDEDYDIYDGYENEVFYLTKKQLVFYTFDINLRDQCK
ncbi:hypothetical protein Tco_0507863, partial [Tanacetum coccineum]